MAIEGMDLSELLHKRRMDGDVDSLREALAGRRAPGVRLPAATPDPQKLHAA